MPAMSYEDVSKMIRSCIVTQKNGIPLRMLKRQFNELVGTNIPYDQLGFPTLVELLKSIPGLRKDGFNQEGDIVLSLDASQSGGMSHIQDMVKRQQNKQVKRSAAKYVVSRPGMMQPRSYFTPRLQRPGPTSGWSAYGRTSFKPESSRFYASAPSFGQTPPYRPTAKPFQASVPPRFSPAPQTKQVPSQVLYQPPRMPAQDAISQNSLHEVSEIQEKFANKENLKPHMDSQNCLTKLNKGANTADNFESKLAESAVCRDVAKMLDVVDIPAGHQRTQDPQVPSNSYLLKNTSIMQLKGNVLSQKLPRTSDPKVKNHQLIGDDYLLYFAFRNLRGKIVTDPLSCGMCYSGMTIQEALPVVRMNAVNISQKVILMLGHSDILGEKYDAVKSKWYMTLLLEELSNLGIDVKLMTLPLLYPHNAVVSKRIEDFNGWLRRLHNPSRFTSVLELANVFNQLPLPTFYKSKKHYPAEKKVPIPMWSRYARSKVCAFLHSYVY